MLSSYIHTCYSFLCKCLCKREAVLHIRPCCAVVLPKLSEECIICRDYLYNTNSGIYRICHQCNNIYHKKCYEQWMNGCPNCRYTDTCWYYTCIHSKCIYTIGVLITYFKNMLSQKII